MLLNRKGLHAVGLIAAIGLSACSQDLSGPGAAAFDPDQTSANLAAVDSAYQQAVIQSLEAMGTFQLNGPALAVAAGDLITAGNPADPTSLTDRAAAASQRLQQVLASVQSSSAPLIPAQWLGKVLVWNGTEYVVDSTQTGPSNGIRFILYAFNPITEKPVEPLIEIGHADVLDVGGASSSAIRLVVVSGDVTFMDYTVEATGVFNAPTITINGFVIDDGVQIDFSLSHALQATVASAMVQIDYNIEASSLDFSVEVHVLLETAGDSSNSSISMTIMNGRDKVTVNGSLTNEQGTLEVAGNGEVFAVITMGPDGISAVGPDGEPLTEREVRALREIMGLVDQVFNLFDDLFNPVQWLFNV